MFRATWSGVEGAVAVLALATAIGCGGPAAPPEPLDTNSDLNVAGPDSSGDTGQVPEADAIEPPDVTVDPEQSTRFRLAEPTSPPAAPGNSAAVGPPITEPASAERESPEPQSPADSAPPEPASTSASTTAGAPSVAPVAGQPGPESWTDWADPAAVLVISGQQHGYIEPCGCTGLDRQKGGLMRRYTFLEQLRQRGWEVVPLDAGNQIRRSGRQAVIKFRTTAKGLAEMGYRAVGFGPDDLRIGASELLSVAASDGVSDNPFTSANVELLDPELMPTVQIVEAGGKKIGVATALDPATLEVPVDETIAIGELREKVATSLEKLNQENCDFRVLLLFGKADAAKQLARDVPGFELVVAAGDFGEPTYRAEAIEGSDSRLILTGDKGMHVGVVGLYEDQPFKYARVALTSEFEDAPEMLRLMAAYQDQLKALGLEGLDIKPIAHPSGREFAGSATCGECHKTAYEIWQGTPHADATESIVHPGERSEIPRHHDPECLSCHVTGWNAEKYYPYTTGYLSLESTPAMTGNGCENCHGPGKAHAEAERVGSGAGDGEIEALRQAVHLGLDSARQKCLECHDLDNSPDFHVEGAFEEYWSQIEHYGVD